MRIRHSLSPCRPARQEYSSARYPVLNTGSGFSVIEMMVVIGIIAIVLAIALPAYSGWHARSAATNAANTLLGHLKQARALAVADNRNVSVTFTSTSYIFDADTTGNCGLCKKLLINTSQFSNRLSISPTTTRTFTSRGTINQSGTITIAAAGYSKQITLNVIGRAYLQ